MQIKTDLTLAGYMPDQYAKAAPENAKKNGTPVISFPFEVSDIPKSANYLAWTMIDVPVTDTTMLIPADFSRKATVGVQGKNSQASKFVGETDEMLTSRYTGPMPPDQPHAYRLAVYAMPEPLSLVPGYYLNEQLRALEGNVLACATLDIWAEN